MNLVAFQFLGHTLHALGSGALHWPDEKLLVVSDLHLGKAARQAMRGGAALPPYETRETLDRLSADMESTDAERVVCLGDSFDAPGMDAALPEEDLLRLSRMQAGVDWTWIEGNHDPGPVSVGGAHRAELTIRDVSLRHIARQGAVGEVSGHYHPKARINARGRMIARPCFLYDSRRLILPAYGAYTGGLRTDDPVFARLFAHPVTAILTGVTPLAVPGASAGVACGHAS